mgnify:CR=1 FL=1
MNKIVYTTLLAITLSGCAGSASTGNYGYYTVDLKNRSLCEGSELNGAHCYPLAMIIPSFNEVHIAKAYGIQPATMQWSTNQFIDILLKPDNGLYQAERTSETTFRLPDIEATRTAYYYIKHEHYLLYESNKRR